MRFYRYRMSIHNMADSRSASNALATRRDDYAQKSGIGAAPDTRHDARIMFWSDSDDIVKVEPRA
jgi:hypothetical protein